MDAPQKESARQPCRREDAEVVLRKLRDAGHVAYFAGGCVRDLLLGIAPKDWDVATDAHPKRVREIFPKTQAVGAKFGVILVRHNSSVIEVATFRTDVSYEDGRHPTEVKFTTAEEDAKRRDFTINGLFLDPTDNDRIIDFVGGQEDLKNKLLRAIGDANLRFEEDHLRLLRAVRFAARFGLMIEPQTADAIAKHAQELARISPERIAEELRMMLSCGTRATAWRLLSEFGLDDVIFRFVPLPVPLPAYDTRDRRKIILFDRIKPGESIQFGLAMSAASLEYVLSRLPDLEGWNQRNLPDVRVIVKATRQALRISNEESDAMRGALNGLEQLLSWIEPTVAEQKRFLAKATADDSRTLLDSLSPLFIERDRRESIQNRLDELSKKEFAPPPLLTGDDLVAAGFRPGPAFKKILDAVYDAQLEDRIQSKEDAMEMARKLLA